MDKLSRAGEGMAFLACVKYVMVEELCKAGIRCSIMDDMNDIIRLYKKHFNGGKTIRYVEELKCQIS